MTGFIFGKGTDTPTYEALQRKRQIADALLAQSQGSPLPKNGWEGANMIAKTLASKYIDHKIAPGEDAERQRITDMIAGITGGGAPSMSSAGPMVEPEHGGFTGAGVAPTAANPYASGGETGTNPIYQGLLQRGLPEPVAQGFMMNFQDESGLNPAINEQNPTVPGSRGGFGLAQWTGPRRDALEQYAAQGRRPVDDANTQLDFLMSELQGPEKGAAAKIMGSQDPGSAAANIAQYFLRPAPEHLQRRVSEYTEGNTDLSGILSGMMPHEPDMGKVSKIAELLGDPYATEGQQAVLKALLDRELKDNSLTPYQALSLGIKARSGNAGAENVYGTPVWGKDEGGNWAVGAWDKSGTFHKIETPEGFSPDPGGTKIVSTGTTQQPVDRAGAVVQPAIPIDVQGEASLKAQGAIGGATVGAAQAQLGTNKQMVDEVTANVAAIVGDPALDSVVGKWNSMKPDLLTSQEGVNVRQRIKQFMSTTFMTARQALKGAGQVTDFEGQKAQEAFAFASEATDPKTFRERMQEGLNHVKRGFEIMQQQAAGDPTGGAMPQAPIPQSAIAAGIDPSLWQYMSPEDQALWLN